MIHEQRAPAEHSGSARRLGVIVALAGLVAFLTINRLGASDVCGSNEAVEAVFLQQMVEDGKLLFPLDDGVDPMYKPPLFHWTATALDRILDIDHVTPFNLRLASALYATAGVALTAGLALTRLGTGGAVISGLVLAASYEYVSLGRAGRVDITLTFYELLSLVSFLAWLETSESSDSLRRRRMVLQYLLAVSLGLAVLAKGPVGAVLPAGAMGLFLGLERRWTDLRRLLKPVPILLGGAIASSWYLACLLGRQYSFLNRQLGSENLGRFFGTLGSMSALYYLKPLLLSAGPISLFAPVTVAAALAQYIGRRDRAAGSDHPDGPAGRMARLIAIFWLITLVFFDLAAYKRKSYLLPLAPASALLIAWWIYVNGIPKFGRLVQHAVIATCGVMILVNFFYIPWHELSDCGANLTLGETLRWPFADREATEQARARQTESYWQAASEINRVVGKNDALFVYGFSEPLEMLLFYLGRNVVPIDDPFDELPLGYVIVPGDVWKDLAARHSRLTAVLTMPHGRHGLVLIRRAGAGGPSGS